MNNGVAAVSIEIAELERDLSRAFGQFAAERRRVAILLLEGSSKLDVHIATDLILAGLERAKMDRLGLVRDHVGVHFLSSSINLSILAARTAPRGAGPRVRAFKTADEAAAWLAETPS